MKVQLATKKCSTSLWHGQQKVISVHLSQLCEHVGTKQMYAWQMYAWQMYAWQMSAFACARHG